MKDQNIIPRNSLFSQRAAGNIQTIYNINFHLENCLCLKIRTPLPFSFQQPAAELLWRDEVQISPHPPPSLSISPTNKNKSLFLHGPALLMQNVFSHSAYYVVRKT